MTHPFDDTAIEAAEKAAESLKYNSAKVEVTPFERANAGLQAAWNSMAERNMLYYSPTTGHYIVKNS